MFKASAQAQSSLDHLTHLEDVLLDRQLVLNGVFKDEIERLLKVQADAEEKLGMVQTVEDADTYRKSAEDYSANLKSQADGVMSSARTALADANAKMDKALSKEK